MCMEDCVKPTLREIPAHIILHVGMNDVPTKKAPEQIAENIVNLAIKLKRKCMSQYQASRQGMINTRGKQQM